jgi:hypothetical protein
MGAWKACWNYYSLKYLLFMWSLWMQSSPAYGATYAETFAFMSMPELLAPWIRASLAGELFTTLKICICANVLFDAAHWRPLEVARYRSTDAAQASDAENEEAEAAAEDDKLRARALGLSNGSSTFDKRRRRKGGAGDAMDIDTDTNGEGSPNRGGNQPPLPIVDLPSFDWFKALWDFTEIKSVTTAQLASSENGQAIPIDLDPDGGAKQQQPPPPAESAAASEAAAADERLLPRLVAELAVPRLTADLRHVFDPYS